MKISKAFLRIGIDARFAGPEGTGLGKYTEKLILNLAKIDKKNEYYIFLRRKNWNLFKLYHLISASTFSKFWGSLNKFQFLRLKKI